MTTKLRTASFQDAAVTNSKLAGSIATAKLAQGDAMLEQPNSSLQIIQTDYTDVFYSTTADVWIDVTGFNATITPSATANKVLINLNIGRGGCGYGVAIKVVRSIGGGSYGDIGALGVPAGASIGTWGMMPFAHTNFLHAGGWSGTFLDTTNTTSAVTYKVQVQTYSSSYPATINRAANINNVNIYASYGYSNIILQEIKG
tara:strand:+ start:714 stop:1316 length:603 start_codon:yes stop_codon:yes gene_type:complete